MSRYTPKVVGTIPSPNQSSRDGRRIQLIVLHSTESDNRPGISDLQGVGGYLARPATRASIHVITDADGHSLRQVPDDRKAWHCMGYNGVALGIEQIGRAAMTHWGRDELRESARWIARWSKLHGVPIRRATVRDGAVIRTGVLRHSDLGVTGGGHHDPGPSYPLQSVLNLASFYRARI